MELQSNIPATASITAGGTVLEVIKGKILKVEYIPGFNRIRYEYTTLSGLTVLTVVDHVDILAADGQALYDIVKTGLPAASNMELRMWTFFYEAFKVRMVEEFSELTLTSQIDLIP